MYPHNISLNLICKPQSYCKKGLLQFINYFLQYNMVFPRALSLGLVHVLEANCIVSSISMKDVCDIYHNLTLVQYIP